MGVFMILCFIVFPFYRKEAPPEPVPPEPIPPTPIPPTPTPQVIIQKQVVAGLLIALKWDVYTGGANDPECSDDIDLYVDAPGPNGRRLQYWYKQTAHEGSPARLVTDSRNGGNEVWLHPCVTPGVYKVSYSFFSQKVNKRKHTNMELIVISGQGEERTHKYTIPGSARPCGKEHKQTLLATITVKDDGDVDVNFTPGD